MREVTRWLQAHRRSVPPPRPEELRALQRLAGSLAQGEPSPQRVLEVESLRRERVLDGGLISLLEVVQDGPPPLLVWDLLRSAGEADPEGALAALEQEEGARRRAFGLLLSGAAALVAAGILAGRMPASPGALSGVGGALRLGERLLAERLLAGGGPSKSAT